MVDYFEELRRHFGDFAVPERLAEWERVKQEHPAGSKVSGKLITKAPFGVWLDIGVGFPALLLITRFAVRYVGEAWDQGPSLGDTIEATVLLFADDKRTLALTQKPLDEERGA